MAVGNGRRRFGRRTGTPALEPPAEPSPDPAADCAVDPAADSAALTEADLTGIRQRLGDYVHVQVRSGVYDVHRLRELTLEAAGFETTDAERADELAREVLSRELIAWHDDAERWADRTDCDRLDAALAELGTQLLVLPALLDRPSLAESLRVRLGDRGCVAYLVADIWHAIDTNVLVLTVLESSGQPSPRASTVTAQAIGALGRAGLLASVGRMDGQVEVALVWQRRP